jgi:CRP/FNR family transcriptional regulator, anaerobic regulatory protein
MTNEQPLGALAVLQNPARDIVQRQMRMLHLKQGQRVFAAGDVCRNYLIVKSGMVRVSVVADTGRELILYHVGPGETCVLTAACLMSGTEYEAEGTAECDTDAYILPKSVFDEVMTVSPEFRQFVFSSFGERLHTLIALVQEITVKHVDRRLAKLLLVRAENGVLAMTHQSIAQELNSAREVVTRLLNDFAGRGWVSLERGKVILHNVEALQAIHQAV